MDQKRLDEIADTLNEIATTLDELKEDGGQLSSETYEKMRQAIDRATDAFDCLDNRTPPVAAQ